MNPEQQAAYIVSQAACANAEIAAMQADNQAALAGNPLATLPWSGQDFRDVILRYGIHHNAVVGFFTGR